MIRIKIIDPLKGRNEPTFRPLLLIQDVLRENYSIDITVDQNETKYDYLFVGMDGFINKKISLDDSINQGLEFLKDIDGDYFLFDGSDSTSLMGAIEVQLNSNSLGLFKNQILKNRDLYKTPYSFGKWFFGQTEDPLIGYELTEKEWNQIYLTGYNLGHLNGFFMNRHEVPRKQDNVSCVFQSSHDENYDHLHRNDILYTTHRESWINNVSQSEKYTVFKERIPREKYFELLKSCKVSLSPFGMGEVCFRDFESLYYSSALIKPSMDDVLTVPNIYTKDTYVKCKLDGSDINECIEFALDNWKDLSFNMSEQYYQTYNVPNLCMHWYEFFRKIV